MSQTIKGMSNVIPFTRKLGIQCMHCARKGAYGDTANGWRLARNAPFRYVCPSCVGEGLDR